MLVRVGCEFVQRATMPTHAVLQVEPRPDGDFHVADAAWDEQTSATSRAYVDALGNVCRRLTLPAGQSVIRFDAHVEVSPEPDAIDTGAVEVDPESLPDSVLSYTLPSRFCPSDELGDIAWELFGAMPQGWGRVQAISDWVHGEVSFGYGSSSPTATAVDVLAARAGVCRDFAHLAVALCRAQHPRALCIRLSPRYRRTSERLHRWTSAPGWRCSSGAAGGRSTLETGHGGWDAC